MVQELTRSFMLLNMLKVNFGRMKSNHIMLCSVAAPDFFLGGGGIEGEKCDSEGAKILKFAENG